jgi:hypothetical protein
MEAKASWNRSGTRLAALFVERCTPAIHSAKATNQVDLDERV